MNAQRWKQINKLFEQALELPSPQRAAFLADACAGDDDLQREVAAMLGADAETHLLMDRPAHEVAKTFFSLPNSESGSGQMIGSYQLLREIGRGGMGRVYLAEDTRLGRQVALKLLPEVVTGAPDRVARFQREARAASALNHPNILTIYDFGREGERHYIASEFVEGQTLRSLVGDSTFTLSQTIDVIAQIAGALSAAHRANIVHRDIKPENVMLRPDGYVKVLDFGLAKLTERNSSAPTHEDARTNDSESESVFKTQSGIVLGTVSYMSPEQAKGEKVDARTDIFSLGVLFYELLTGRHPFTRNSRAEIIVALLEHQPPPLAESRPDLPADLQPLLDRMLAKTAQARCASTAQLRDELKALQEQMVAARVRTSGASSAQSGQPAPTGRITAPDSPAAVPTGKITRAFSSLTQRPRFWLWAALFVMALLAGGIFTYAKYARFAGPDSIAVLPFVYINAAANAGSPAVVDADSAYLADGFTESVINQLAQIEGLKVIARDSVFRYKNQVAEPSAVAAALQVRAVLTGRITQRDDQMTVNVALADASRNQQIWGRQYDSSVAGLAALQQTLARDISAQLRGEPPDSTSAKAAEQTNAEAYQLYSKGRYYWNKRTGVGVQRSIEFYKQATDLDPGYALAYAGLADAYDTLITLGLAAPHDLMPLIKATALKALELDPALGEAYVPLAKYHALYRWDWAEGERHFQRALALNPNHAHAHHQYGLTLTFQGRYAEALRELRQAKELDPLSPIIDVGCEVALFCSGKYDEAIAQTNRSLAVEPGFYAQHLVAATLYAQIGKPAEANAAAEQARQLPGGTSSMSLAFVGYVYAVTGRRAEAQQTLAQLHTMAATQYVSPFFLAVIYAGLNEREQSLMWMEKAAAEHDHWLTYWLKGDPRLNHLRGDPRFAALLRQTGLSG